MLAAPGRSRRWYVCLPFVASVFATLVMTGCGGDDGDSGPTTIDVPAGDSGGGGESATPPTPANLTGPTGRIDIAYSYDVAAQDPLKETRTWTLATGELPEGLTLSEAGAIGGTPAKTMKSSATLLGQGECGTAACRWEVHLDIEVAPILLLGGFGPFGSVKDNPSWLAAEKLDKQMIAGHDVRAVLMPVSWAGAPAELFEAYAHLRPVITIASGVDTSAQGVRLESQALNKALGQDVDGEVKQSGPIDPNGPDAIPTMLPVEDLRVMLEQAGYTAGISESAGTFLCNFIFYELMQKVTAEPPEQKLLAGFVHVPSVTTLDPEKMAEAWKLIIDKVVTYRAGLVAGNRSRALPPTITIFTPPKFE